METSADYVIAGGGSAGCVLANRLSANPRNRVILLEAGGTNDRFWVKVPAGMSRIIGTPQTNWFYATEPDDTLGGRRVFWHAGKMLGGGSSINGMAYVRGTRADYDSWASQGCTGWAWSDVLPYFRKAEGFAGEPSQTHGTLGPLGVSPPRVMHPLGSAFMAACAEQGLPLNDDYCDGDQEGSFVPFATQRDGMRSSTAASYLAQARERANLKVITHALVDRVLLEDGKAVGIVYRQNGQEHIARAKAEVIVSAGAMGTPPILLRSGIGPGAHLQSVGVKLAYDSKNVGRNIYEHTSVHNSRLTSIATYNAIKNPFRLALEGLNYIYFKRGMLATPAVHGMASVKSRPDVPQADIRLQMLPFCSDFKTQRPHTKSGMVIAVSNLFPKSRGEVRLRSADPEVKPILDYRMLAHQDDLDVLRAGMKFTDRLYQSPALAKYVVDYNFPAAPVGERSDAEWDELLRAYAGVGFHPVSSCRMGADADAPVDSELRVRGVGNLRVIDASVMPILPCANTNAPTIMIAEKGADLILAEGRAR